MKKKPSLQKHKEVYSIDGVSINLVNKTKAYVEDKEVIGKDRLDLLKKIGDILQEEYEFHWTKVFAFYNVVELR